MKAYQEASAGATPKKVFPRLPWPLPLEGVRVGVGRWWHGPTEKRDAWWVVYSVEVRREESYDEGQVYFFVRLRKYEEDYFTKRVSGDQIICPCEELVLKARQLKAAKPPEELARAWAKMVEQARSRAAKD